MAHALALLLAPLRLSTALVLLYGLAAVETLAAADQAEQPTLTADRPTAASASAAPTKQPARVAESQEASKEAGPADKRQMHDKIHKSEGISAAESEVRIRRALDEPATMEFTETPLQNVVEYLKDVHKIEIQFDYRALNDSGVEPDVPITRTIAGLPLRNTLNLMLSDLDLDYVIKDGVLLITTTDVADRTTVVRVYDVSGLVGADPENLTNALHRLLCASRPRLKSAGVTPTTVNAPGSGAGAAPPNESPAHAALAADKPASLLIFQYRELLLVRASEKKHAELEVILAAMRNPRKSAATK